MGITDTGEKLINNNAIIGTDNINYPDEIVHSATPLTNDYQL